MKLQSEREDSYPLLLSPAMLNPAGVMKLQAYPALYCELGDRHLHAYEADIESLKTYGVAWALIALAMDVTRPAPPVGLLDAVTWKSGRRGPYFMRDYTFTDGDGQLSFAGSSASVLLNLQTRKVSRDKRIPYYSLTADKSPLTQLTPTWKQAYGQLAGQLEEDLVQRERRSVRSSDLDLLGHVNNIRYAEFVYDCMSDEEIASLARLKRLEIYFSSELRRGEDFLICAARSGDTLFYRGLHADDRSPSFDLVIRTAAP